MRRVRLSQQMRTGKKRWPGCASNWSCRRTGRVRRSRVTGAVRFPSVLSGELHRKLQNVARDHEATLFKGGAGGHRGVAEPVGRRDGHPSGQSGRRTHGRGAGRIESGSFVNTLVLRTDTSGEPSFKELLARVRDHTCRPIPIQDIPFERWWRSSIRCARWRISRSSR